MMNLVQSTLDNGRSVRVTVEEVKPTYVDVPRHVWDAVNNAIHTSSINGNEKPISLCYVAVRAALKAYIDGSEAV